jgi:hypothetical protein
VAEIEDVPVAACCRIQDIFHVTVKFIFRGKERNWIEVSLNRPVVANLIPAPIERARQSVPMTSASVSVIVDRRVAVSTPK